MAFAASSPSSLSSQINMTPLIDVLLVLLIIFMVVAPVSPAGMDSSIPQGKPAANELPPVLLRLLSDQANNSAYDQIARQSIAPAALKQRLQSMFAIRQDKTILIEADRSLSYREVAAAVSDARDAGAGAVVLSGLH